MKYLDWIVDYKNGILYLFKHKLMIMWSRKCVFCPNQSNQGEGQWICCPDVIMIKKIINSFPKVEPSGDKLLRGMTSHNIIIDEPKKRKK